MKDEELDSIVTEFLECRGLVTRQVYNSGYLQFLGLGI